MYILKEYENSSHKLWIFPLQKFEKRCFLFFLSLSQDIYTLASHSYIYTQTDRQIDRLTDRGIGRQIDRQTDRQIDYSIDTPKTKGPIGLNFDFDDSFSEYCLAFLHFCFCNWIQTPLFQELGFWITDVFTFLNFVTD